MTEPLPTPPSAPPAPPSPSAGRLRGPLIHPVVVGLTVRDLLGRRRLVLFAVLPLVLLGLAVTSRALRGAGGQEAADILQQAGFGALLPLVALIAATGTLAPQIDDGSVVYLLAKPLSRHAIIRSQALVAYLTVVTFAVVPMIVGGVIDEGRLGAVTRSLAVGALAAGAAYVALFTLLSVVSRNAVLLGLIYALIWEGVVGGYVPGAKNLSDPAVGSEHLREHARHSCQGAGRRLTGRGRGRRGAPRGGDGRLALARRSTGCAACGCGAATELGGQRGLAARPT